MGKGQEHMRDLSWKGQDNKVVGKGRNEVKL